MKNAVKKYSDWLTTRWHSIAVIIQLCHLKVISTGSISPLYPLADISLTSELLSQHPIVVNDFNNLIKEISPTAFCIGETSI